MKVNHNYKYLKFQFSIGNDCMLRPGSCHSNASCVETHQKVSSKWKYHQCVCNPGYVGNGLFCVEASSISKGNYLSKSKKLQN